MSESMREVLAREASEAETRAEAEERGEIAPMRGQRGRKRAADPSQVYAVRIPVSKLRRLRQLAEELEIAPSALIRQWVIERLDESDVQAQQAAAGSNVKPSESESSGELRLGPRRRPIDSRPNEPYAGEVRRRA